LVLTLLFYETLSVFERGGGDVDDKGWDFGYGQRYFDSYRCGVVVS
jgi:hypothetical protein